MTTWILVAQRSGARIFRHDTPGDGLHLVSTIPHELGRARDSEIASDRPGRVVNSSTLAQTALHSEGPPSAGHRRFREVAGEILNKARLEQRFSRLILVAEPRMLGLLRDDLDAPTSALVTGSLDKDYYPRDQDHLEQALAEFIQL